MNRPETIPQFFLESAIKYGETKTALRQKRFGYWEETSWKESYDNVRNLALGLVRLGLKRGERVAIIGDNDLEYIWADLASLSAGSAVVGIFTDVTPKEIEYLINHSDATFVFAKDQEQCDKLLAVKEKIPNVKKVIYWDERGLWNYDDPWLIDFKDVQNLGLNHPNQSNGFFKNLVYQGKKEEPAAFCYTSGTTGMPKGAVLSHYSLIFYYKAISDIDPRTSNDNHMSFLSLAWVAEHVMGVAAHVIDQIILNFPESPETIQANIREIAPQIILYNSRLWENLVQTVQDRISDSSWINRLIYKVFLPVGYKVAEAALNEEKVNLWLRILYKIGDFLLYSPVRDKLGLIRVRIALTTGAALSAKVIRFFYAIGIHIRQLYGATEAGIAAMHRENDINFYTVGQVIPGYEIQISTEGEILIHSPAIFNGYHKDQEKSRKAVSIDDDDKCWFKTGDAGALTDKGHLVYYDRMDDMIQLSGGNLYSPQYIEGRLKFNPAIRDVMTLGGNGYSYVTAIITINMETVGRWAEKSGIPYTTFLDLSQKAEVYDMLDDAIKEVNRNLAPPARVKRFVSLHKEFDADEGEITRTRKLRRNFLQDRYGKIIEAMYDEYNSVEVDASVQYRDGRTSSVEAKLRIATIETEENDQP